MKRLEITNRQIAASKFIEEKFPELARELTQKKGNQKIIDSYLLERVQASIDQAEVEATNQKLRTLERLLIISLLVGVFAVVVLIGLSVRWLDKHEQYHTPVQVQFLSGEENIPTQITLNEARKKYETTVGALNGWRTIDAQTPDGLELSLQPDWQAIELRGNDSITARTVATTSGLLRDLKTWIEEDLTVAQREFILTASAVEGIENEDAQNQYLYENSQMQAYEHAKLELVMALQQEATTSMNYAGINQELLAEKLEAFLKAWNQVADELNVELSLNTYGEEVFLLYTVSLLITSFACLAGAWFSEPYFLNRSIQKANEDRIEDAYTLQKIGNWIDSV